MKLFTTNMTGERRMSMTENEALKLGKSLHENLTSNANNIIPTKEYIEFVEIAIQALEEREQYRAIGTVEELQELKEKLQGYKNQMSIYAEQHKVILASDVLDMLEEIDWQ